MMHGLLVIESVVSDDNIMLSVTRVMHADYCEDFIVNVDDQIKRSVTRLSGK